MAEKVYIVTAQQETRVPDPQGRLIDAIEILYDIPMVGSFREVVPKALYTREYVEELLNRNVGLIIDIQNL